MKHVMSIIHRCEILYARFTFIALIFLAPGIGVSPTTATSPAHTPDIDAAADSLEFLQDESVFIGRGNVEIRYHDIVVTADEIRANTASHDFEARGEVTLTYDGFSWQGEEVAGNLKTRQFDFGHFQSSIAPWYIVGASGERTSDGSFESNDMAISTCDYLVDGSDHWRMQCRRLVYHGDGSFHAYDVTYRVMGVPVFFLPVVWGSLDNDIGGFHLSAGYEDDMGFFLDISKEWDISDAVRNEAGVIYRTKRGFAVKNETGITTSRSQTIVSAYAMDDRDPISDTEVGNEEFNGRFKVDNERYRLKLAHRSNPGNRLRLTVNADHFSDNNILFEFFERDFRNNPQPVSFADATWEGDRFTLSLTYRPRLNDFESVVERLPELRLNVPRIQVAGYPIYLESESTAVSLRMRWRELDLPRNAGLLDPEDYETSRIDTRNFLYAPFTVSGWRLVPRVGAALTYYSRTSKRDISASQLNSVFLADDPRATTSNANPVTNYDDDGGDQFRTAYELGAELGFTRAREWTDFENKRLKINGLRHVVQPYVNYTFIPDPNVDSDNLFFFDEIDRVDDVHFIRFGGRHHFQTRRGAATTRVGYMENFYDVFLNPGDERDRPGDFGTIISVQPAEDIALWGKILVDTDDGDVNVFNAGLSLTGDRLKDLNLSYLYRDDYLSRYNYSMGSELTQILSTGFIPVGYQRNHSLHLNFNVPFGPDTSLRCQYFFDLEKGRVGRQRYELTRHLHCWVAGLGIEQDEDDFSVYMLWYLKAFPKVRLDFGS